jgi:hypothetical protein
VVAVVVEDITNVVAEVVGEISDIERWWWRILQRW